VFPDAEVEIIAGSGGVFEIEVDGDLVFSKKALDRHAEPGEVLALVEKSQRAE
jgi:selT/selW/selH-like putative selenoprotein